MKHLPPKTPSRSIRANPKKVRTESFFGKKLGTKDVIDNIEPKDAKEILRVLCEADKILAKKVASLVLDTVWNVDIEDVAGSVYWDLDLLSVEDVYNRSGSKRDGYHDSGDEAYFMFEEAIEPHIEKMKKYASLGMLKHEKLFCMGILKGIFLFEKESESEYKREASDAPWTTFFSVYRDWKKTCRSAKSIKDVKEFIRTECPKYYLEKQL